MATPVTDFCLLLGNTASRRFKECESGTISILTENTCNFEFCKMATVHSEEHEKAKPGKFCLCEKIRPILCLSQILGVSSVNISHEDTAVNNSHQQICILQTKRFSWISLLHYIVFAYLVFISLWVFLNTKGVLAAYFSGTTLYTLVMQVMAMYIQIMVILIGCFWKRKKIVETWKTFHAVFLAFHTIISQENEKILDLHKTFVQWKQLKYFSYTIISIIAISTVFYGTYFLGLLFGSNANLDVEKRQGFYEISNTLQKITHSFIVLYSQSFAALFAVFCIIVHNLYMEIKNLLKNYLTFYKYSDLKDSATSKKIERIRIMHEKLNKATRLISSSFGAQILAVTATSVLSLTCGIYTVVLHEGQSSEYGGTNREQRIPLYFMYYIWAFHAWFSLFQMTLILIPGQMVTNAAMSSLYIISEAPLSSLNAEAKFQLSIFQHQASRSDLGISACNITNIRLSFIAAVATNLTTYILVILQFRLGVDDKMPTNCTAISN